MTRWQTKLGGAGRIVPVIMQRYHLRPCFGGQSFCRKKNKWKSGERTMEPEKKLGSSVCWISSAWGREEQKRKTAIRKTEVGCSGDRRTFTVIQLGMVVMGESRHELFGGENWTTFKLFQCLSLGSKTKVTWPSQERRRDCRTRYAARLRDSLFIIVILITYNSNTNMIYEK